MDTKFIVPSPEYEASRIDNKFQVVPVRPFRISMASYTVPT
jgi:hypothetical protein